MTEVIRRTSRHAFNRIKLSGDERMSIFMEDLHMNLHQFFTRNPKAAVAFSGGVDSAYLLYAAKSEGCDVRAYFVDSAFQPAFELEDARRLSEELSIPLTIINVDVLQSKEVAANPKDRCYHCKNMIFKTIIQAACEDGYDVLLDGTNASDDANDRPGMKALAKLKVRSPLRECGLTKSEIRQSSKAAGLFTWNKPSYACLATRIPTGTTINISDLEKVEQAETYLEEAGFRDFRVRLIGDMAKIQISQNDMNRILSERENILEKFAPLFSETVLDLRTRGGDLDE